MNWRGLLRFSTLFYAATFALGSATCAKAEGFLGSLGRQMTNPMAAPMDVDARQGSIHERLRDAIEAGRLTDENIHTIRDQLQKVAAQEAAYKSKNGEISSWQTMQLQMDLDRISKELEADLTERKGGPVDVMAERNLLATRLTDALAVQKLTQPEYDQFFADLTKIDQQIAASKGPDGKLTTNDQVKIALSLDNLSQRFTAGEHQRQADMSAIDKRKDEIRAEIRAGVAEGRLTEDEVDDIRQQLYNYEDKESKKAHMGRPLTPDEELSLALELERFDAEVRARMDNGTGVKITDKTVGYRRAALDQTFANALFSGDISVAEATDLKNSLEQIGTEEATLRSQGGGQLTPDQIRTLLITVEKLKGRFSRLTYNREKPWGGVDGLVNEIKLKINTATAAGRLTGQESDDLQSKIADVLVAKSNERNPQGFVTTESALTLASEISALAAEVTGDINARTSIALPDLQKRQQAVNSSIADGIDSGRLTAAQAGQLLSQLNGIAATEAKLAASGSTADQSAQSAVAASLDALTAAVKKSEHENTDPLVSIEQLKYEVDREITARTFNSKLTAKEAAALRIQYNRIVQTEKIGRAVATGLDATTALTIRNNLTKLLKDTKDIKNTAASR